ncbi:circadian clock KaiC-like protein [Thermococcus paralvinellae]|uniref:Circadian clock KaiC-like protein n=2 Tax=Thermococcus paralvinellae TaxID=582419 RepID=W0I500_9EURY|nr:circadian clock KaiC-like protein [Thermococcus paralvinellae]
MLNGGLIPGRAYLIKGGPGTGKTILSIHFLMEGVKNGEKVLYITLEEPIEILKEDMRKLGFDIDNPLFVGIDATPVKEKRSIFEGFHYEEFAKGFTELVRAVRERLKEDKFTRVVIDPITMIKLTMEDELEYRRTFLAFLKEIANYNVTLFLTSEVYEMSIEDYLVSGVIELKTFETGGKTVRGIKVVKFRGSDFDETMRPYKITSSGIEVYSEETIL